MSTLRIAFSIREVCEATGLSKSALYIAWKRNAGPAKIKVGKRTLISADALAEWLRQLEHRKPSAPSVENRHAPTLGAARSVRSKDAADD